ncbi:MAG: hypothetical protein GX346_01560 [Clostridiales bacterium]|nr:hypothetical protein [Clostridiales bacterium]
MVVYLFTAVKIYLEIFFSLFGSVCLIYFIWQWFIKRKAIKEKLVFCIDKNDLLHSRKEDIEALFKCEDIIVIEINSVEDLKEFESD